jgi:hypothetical protein
MNIEGSLLEKLRKIEALHAGTTVDGEREAARRARDRILQRLEEIRSREKEVVLVYRLPDPWTRQLFVALCRRYGLRPYREPRQRATTVQVCAPETFQRKTLWPEFSALAAELRTHLAEITARVVREAINDDVSEAVEATGPKALPGPGDSEA